jgi:hypothetical protein
MGDTHKRYSWTDIQRDVDAGLRFAAIHRKYGVHDASWYLAIKRGDLVVGLLPKPDPPTERKCTRCGEVKPIEDFFVRNKERATYNVYCKACNREYHKGHYRANKTDYCDKANKRKIEFAKWWRVFKGTLKCQVCGESHIACLDFHHRNPKEKDANVSRIIRGEWSRARVLKEIEKCDILCSNCHRKLHFEDRSRGKNKTDSSPKL